MATPKKRRPRTWTLASYITSGFDALTLAPSPRLRLLRTRLQRRNYYLEAQQTLSRAMTQAIADLETRQQRPR